MTKRRPDPAAFARDVIRRYPVVLEHLRALELPCVVRLANGSTLIGHKGDGDTLKGYPLRGYPVYD